MVPNALSKEEIKKRLTKLHNLENLHLAQRFKIWHLRDENRALRKEVKELKSVMSDQQQVIETLKLHVEELRTIVFGKKQKKTDEPDDDMTPPSARIPRSMETYHRPVPNNDEVRETKEYPINNCTVCKDKLEQKEVRIYYEEDIPLPARKIVRRHTVERGYCIRCKEWRNAIPTPSASVVLGTTVTRYVTYLSVICRLSYSQIKDFLSHTYNFKISQGEIAKLLGREGTRLGPELERLKERIRGEPSVHLDETSWPLFMGDGYQRYAWVMAGGESEEAVFELGKTRGKGNADMLLHDSKAVVVSDDYGVYRNLNNPHQLCWAHPLRKLRDLSESGELDGNIRGHCTRAYTTFRDLYARVEQARVSDDSVTAIPELKTELLRFTTPRPLDPNKLRRIKESTRARIDCYFTCLVVPNVHADNNLAERSLRHLVLKRKISFGSLTERTADILATLVSVLLSYRTRGMLRSYLLGEV